MEIVNSADRSPGDKIGNPVEYLWAWLMRHALANDCPNSLDQLQGAARNKIKNAQKRPSFIAACWVQTALW